MKPWQILSLIESGNDVGPGKKSKGGLRQSKGTEIETIRLANIDLATDFKESSAYDRAKTTFQFLDLPQEIQDQIYTEAIISGTPTELLINDTICGRNLALRQVCRKFRDDLRKLLPQLNLCGTDSAELFLERLLKPQVTWNTMQSQQWTPIFTPQVNWNMIQNHQRTPPLRPEVNWDMIHNQQWAPEGITAIYLSKIAMALLAKLECHKTLGRLVQHFPRLQRVAFSLDADTWQSRFENFGRDAKRVVETNVAWRWPFERAVESQTCLNDLAYALHERQAERGWGKWQVAARCLVRWINDPSKEGDVIYQLCTLTYASGGCESKQKVSQNVSITPSHNLFRNVSQNIFLHKTSHWITSNVPEVRAVARASGYDFPAGQLVHYLGAEEAVKCGLQSSKVHKTTQ
ncbi:hypothetical protein LTR05_002466 [Lithohypha guttulata]|uniref:F-box domain-containing protein n=1 Tax=Lithohypha guttulata TaxID=1690604 RepID=A0AAN7T4X8_9EURO|nr:hypothetical protein LTR05_002466 [Lithohypha guttulata]